MTGDPKKSPSDPPHLLMWGIIVGLVLLVCVGWWWSLRFTFAQNKEGWQELWQEVKGTKENVVEQTQTSRGQLTEAFDAMKQTMSQALGEQVKDRLTSEIVEDMKGEIETQQESLSSEQEILPFLESINP